MGVFKWIKDTFFGGGSSSSQKKKKKNSGGGGGGGSSSSSSPRMVDSSTYTKSYQAYKKGAEKRKSQTQKAKSDQKKAEDNWGNVFSRGTIWTNATKSTNVDHSKIKNPVKDALDSKAKESTEKKYKYKSFSDKAQDAIKKALTEEGDKTSPQALSGKGKGVLNKAAKKAVKAQDTHEKFMGDEKKTNAQKKLEQKIGDAKRENKELEYESKYHPKSLYTARRFASGVTLGGEKVLEKKTNDDAKKALKKDDRAEKEDWIKLSDDDKRESEIRGLHGKIKAKGISGKAIGEVTEIAGNMATYGATSSLTKGIGEKGLNRVAKLTKKGETAQEALEKSKFVQKLAKGSPDKAKDIASKLANGLAEDYGINKTTGAVQSAIDASIKKSEDKDSSWGKEFAKNQALNMATGGATELGLSVLRNRKARKEAEKLLPEMQRTKAKETLSPKSDAEKAVEALKEKSSISTDVENNGKRNLALSEADKKKTENRYTNYIEEPEAASNVKTEANADVQKAVNVEGKPVSEAKTKETKADPFASFQADEKTKKRLSLNYDGTNTSKKEFIEKNYDREFSEVNQNNGKEYFFVKDENGKKHAINKDQHEYAQHLKSLNTKPVETGAVEKAAAKEAAENTGTDRAAELATKSAKLDKERSTVVSQMKELESKHSALDLADNDEYINLRNKLDSIDDERFDAKKELEKHNSAAQEQTTRANEAVAQSLDEIKAKKAAIQKEQTEHLDAVKRGEQQIDTKKVAKLESEIQSLDKQEKSVESGEMPQSVSTPEKSVETGIESVELKKRGAYENSTDAMLDNAEAKAKAGELYERPAEKTDVHETVKSLKMDDFSKDNQLDKVVLDLKHEYTSAVERRDAKEADRLANEIVKTYNARQYVNDYGTEIAERALSGRKATMQDMSFHIPSADELKSEIGQKATTVDESSAFAKYVDKLDAEHKSANDNLKTGKTVKTMYNNAQSDEARAILSDNATKGFYDTFRKHTKQDANKIIEDVVRNPDAIARELQAYLDETKGFYGKDAYTAMLKAQSLYAYCTRHVTENEGFQKGLAISSNYIAEYGGLAGNTMNAMSVFASCSPQRKTAEALQIVRRFANENGMKKEDAERLEAYVMEKMQSTDADEMPLLLSNLNDELQKISGNKGVWGIINTWRHFAMLSAPKTQTRNLSGNLVGSGERAMSDVIASKIQDMLLKSGKIDHKTVGTLSGSDVMALFKKNTHADAKIESMNKYLEKDINFVMKTSNKFGDLKKYWYKNDNAFYRGVEKASDVVNTGLELGDRIFVAENYKKRYMQFMNANGFNENEEKLLKETESRKELLSKLHEYEDKLKGDEFSEADEKLYNRAKLDLKKSDDEIKRLKARKNSLETEARNLAKKEAAESTYREVNEFADKLTGIKNKGKRKDASFGEKVAGVAVEATLPYINTPANIMRQGVRYSPAGLIVNGAKFCKAITAETPDVMLINELAERVAGGITGTGVFAIGAYLGMKTYNNFASLVTSLSSDDPEDTMNKGLGYQEYSLIIGGDGNKRSISLDWLTPSAAALFLGASAGQYAQKIGEATSYSGSMWDSASGLLNVANDVLQPVFETSMLDTFDNILTGANSDSKMNPIMNVVTNISESAVASMFPNALRGVAKTIRPYEYNSVTTAESEGGQSLERWAKNLRNGFNPFDTGDANTDIWGNITGKRGKNLALSAVNNILNPANVKKVRKSKVDEENADLYKSLLKDGESEDTIKNVIPKKFYKTDVTVSASGASADKEKGVEAAKLKLNAADVSLVNQARATKAGAREALYDLVVDNKAFNKESVRLSDSEKEKLLNKDFKNTKEVVEWLHGTKAWKKGTNKDRASMQKTVLGQNGGTKQKGSVKAGLIDVYEKQGKTETDFRYDNDVTAAKKAKLKDLANSKGGKKKILDFAEGAENMSYSEDGSVHHNHPQKTMLPYLNDAVASGKLTEKEAAALFDAYKAPQTTRSYHYGMQPSSGWGSGYKRRYYRRGYSRRGRRSGGGGSGSSSAGVGKVVQIKTSAFNPTVTSSDYKSWASKSSSKSSKSTKIKSQISSSNSAPKVKAPDPIIKTKKKS